MSDKPIAYDAYQKLADSYAALIDTKPHNAYCERPAMIGLLPELRGRRVLDVGCGPGIYAELLLARGAVVTSIDASDRMLENARKRLGPDADLRLLDFSRPLDMFADHEFDFVMAPLCLDYVQDWRSVFREFHRILKPGGIVQFSCSHPASDAELHQTNNYFSVEYVTYPWKGFGIPVVVPSYRRSLQEILMPVIEAGFHLNQILEPLPTDQFRAADPRRYQILTHRPCFLCVQARKAG